MAFTPLSLAVAAAISTRGPGGGFGVNFFFLRYVGIGYEASWFDNRRHSRSSSARRRQLVPPLSLLHSGPRCPNRWAVALRGMAMAPATEMSEAGLEYRFTDHIGIFVDGRYFYGTRMVLAMSANLRAGMRFAF